MEQAKGRPSLRDLKLGSVKSVSDLRAQADLIARIADVAMDDYLETAPKQIKTLQAKGVPKQVLFGSAGTLFFAVVAAILLLYGFQVLSAFVTVLQPLYYTFKALESTQKDDDTVWLTYWMVHGVLHLCENTIFAPFVMFLPGLYFAVKIGVQLWMVNFEGSTTIYNSFLAPYLRKREKDLDRTIEMAKQEALAAVGIANPHPDEIKEKQEEEELKQAAARDEDDDGDSHQHKSFGSNFNGMKDEDVVLDEHERVVY